MSGRAWFGLALALLVGWLLWRLAPVLTPFLVGALVAYLLDPPVERLCRLGLSRALAVSLVFAAGLVLSLLALLLALPLLERQLERFLAALPGYLAWLEQSALPWLRERLGIVLPEPDPERALAWLRENWRQAGSWLGTGLAGAARTGAALLGALATVLLIPVVVFYLLLDWPRLIAAIDALIPEARRERVRELAREADEALGAFLRGQLAVMLALAVLHAAALALIGLSSAVPIGLLAGLLSFVPYLGLVVGLVAALLAAWVELGGLAPLLWVLVAFAGIQMLDSLWLTPRLVGSRVGLHPLMVIFAVLAGGQLFGFLGVLLALPAAAVIAALARRLLGPGRAPPAEPQGAGP
ncbi:MAG: AI-2E family transporter [Xanthomonadales bacterium]|nr:AI-2E family transporter [Xanthomonadales bacterium]